MSEGMAMGIGILIAMFGPLLLLPVIWAIARWPLRRLIGHWTDRRFGRQASLARLGVSAVLVGAVVLATYLPGRIEFAHLCEAHAEPIISERVDVPGFYATELYPYRAERFLREWGFDYVEAPDMYKKGRTLRYTVGADGKTVVLDVPVPTSRYAVSDTTRVLGNTLTLTEKRVFELSTGRELARAGNVTYHGGPLSWAVLGIFGISDCPNPRYEKGGRQFDDFYYLERKVLRSSFAQKK
jgi:hypothetical protein